MASYRKEFFSAGSIVSYFRTLFGRSRQNPAKVALESDKCWTIVDTDRASRDVGESVNEDTGPQPSAAFLQVQPPLPPECRRLSSKDIVIYGDHPARSGIFTDVWDGSLDGAPVVIKSYRLYSTADSTNICMRLCKEALACSWLSHRNIVPFRAAYITSEHPLALVYDFMEHRCLREYVKENIDVKRVRLLVDIVRGLLHMHDLDIIHGNLTINNILVDLDGTARIAGLGSAFVSALNDPIWSEMDAEILSYGTAPELVRPSPPGSRIRTTKECDIYAFGMLAWELFAGHVPFPNIHPLGAVYLLTKGDRPPRPPHAELSDKVWNVIERCWDDDPSIRPPVQTICAILEEELSRNAFAQATHTFVPQSS